MKPLGIDDILDCYRRGVFPMAEARHDDRIFLVDPDERGVLPLHGFHVPRRLARTIRAEPYEIKTDTAFTDVIRACAAPARGRTETWINPAIEQIYADLFALGHAHSVETWKDGALVGGLYGVSIGGAFFGESMFSAGRDASKVALVHLVARLAAGGYALLDAQFVTGHLTQFGAEEVTRAVYLGRLKAALDIDADFYRLAPFSGGEAVLQAISQAS